jgi:SAM-dependent methyltransferase
VIFKGIEICCPRCKGDLQETADGSPERQDRHSISGPQSSVGGLRCSSCDQRFPIVLGIPDLRIFPDPYIDAEADRAKGLRVAARFDELSFAELIDFYYSITPVVSGKNARQYKIGMMTGVARAEGALNSWEANVGTGGRVPAGSILDVGCGTAPLLVAARSRYQKLVGVDIAFRWLVVAKKRLAEAKLEIPLICACAEALPFPDGTFDRVVAYSVLELLKDQRQGLIECHRTLRPGGYLFVATPNRFSLGPDPHVGLWGGGLLPDAWITAYVRHNGGLPPKRALLSAQALHKLIKMAGFRSPNIELPAVPAGQRNHYGKSMRSLIGLYQLARRLPVSRSLLYMIGPFLHASAEKPDQVA